MVVAVLLLLLLAAPGLQVLLLLCRSSRVLLREGQAVTGVQPGQLPCLRQGHSRRDQGSEETGARACMDADEAQATAAAAADGW